MTAPLDATIRPPGSKSITNRALVIAALARGRSTLTGALASDDTLVMAAALRALGIRVDADGDASTLIVDGCGGSVPPGPADLWVGNAGTAARFLPPLVALGAGPYRLDGSARMRQRPIGPLTGALRELGATVSADTFPLEISGGRQGDEVAITGDLSSQYLSGLLLSAPARPAGLAVTVIGQLVSQPYVDLTLATMRAFGARAVVTGDRILVEPGGYAGRSFAIEPDASAASYWFAAAAITGGRIAVQGLGSGSRQGDLAFVHLLERMGCRVTIDADQTIVQGPPPGSLAGIEADLRDISDTAQTLAAIAPYASGPTRATGIGFIRGKETDRIGAVVTELRRAGIEAVDEPDGFLIRPGQPRAAAIETYDDHRMAMSFAILGLRAPGIEILDPDCVSKTYPGFFTDLDLLRRP